MPHLLRHGTSVYKVISEKPLFYLLNAVRLAKEQLLHILNVLGLTQSGAKTHDLPFAKREHYYQATANGSEISQYVSYSVSSLVDSSPISNREEMYSTILRYSMYNERKIINF
jgi:hypothetical protein